MFKILKIGVEKVLSEVLPNECASCGAEISPFRMLCPRCESEIKGPNPLPEKHRWYTLHYFSKYEGVLRKVILSYKNGRWRLRKTLGDLYMRMFEYFPPMSDSLVFIPSTFEALEIRGFDHMELLARYISKSTGIPMSKSLVDVSGARQKGKKAAERLENVNRFEVIKFPGSEVILIDDVYTTGATVKDAVRALRESGVSRVKVYVLARA